ncbi:MAG TPA: universal stress protein [Bryobacteraceae bacterium]|nr:universal stress protein [Bryobacteraceae bacterium]
MLQLTKILVPVDFSAASDAAVHQAAALARHWRSELTLLHIGEQPALWPAAADGLDGIAVRRLRRPGDPAREIIAVAKSDRPDLILMPTHGYGPVRRFFVGSVTARVLHDVGCPVWTEPHAAQTPDTPSEPWRRMICGVVFGPEDAGALSWSVGFAAGFHAELTVAHALPMPSEGIYLPSWREKLRRKTEERLKAMVQDLPVPPLTAVLDGPAPDALASAVRECHARLLVIGRRPPSEILGRLNSEAYEIIRCSPCPVVSV